MTGRQPSARDPQTNPYEPTAAVLDDTRRARDPVHLDAVPPQIGPLLGASFRLWAQGLWPVGLWLLGIELLDLGLAYLPGLLGTGEGASQGLSWPLAIVLMTVRLRVQAHALIKLFGTTDARGWCGQAQDRPTVGIGVIWRMFLYNLIIAIAFGLALAPAFIASMFFMPLAVVFGVVGAGLGLLLLSRWIVAEAVIVLEGRKLTDATSRSSRLTRGRARTVLPLFLIIISLGVGVSLIDELLQLFPSLWSSLPSWSAWTISLGIAPSLSAAGSTLYLATVVAVYAVLVREVPDPAAEGPHDDEVPAGQIALVRLDSESEAMSFKQLLEDHDISCDSRVVIHEDPETPGFQQEILVPGPDLERAAELLRQWRESQIVED